MAVTHTSFILVDHDATLAIDDNVLLGIQASEACSILAVMAIQFNLILLAREKALRSSSLSIDSALI